jgi:Tfp pilus assembly protein PilF
MLVFVFFSCGTFRGASKPPAEVPLTRNPGAPEAEFWDFPADPEFQRAGTADEIRSLVESGTAPSLIRALDLIRSRSLGESEFGRVMNALAVNLLKKVYTGLVVQFPPVDPPRNHLYTRLLQDAEGGRYTPPEANSRDYLEHVLPFLAYLQVRNERILSAVPDLEEAQKLNPKSVLAPYFLGLIYERTGRLEEAREFYNRVYTLSKECYPAVLGLVRILETQGRRTDGINLLLEQVQFNPDNRGLRRQLAFFYYRDGAWSTVEPLLGELIQEDPKDSPLYLMRAHALAELGRILQAQPLLDVYGASDSTSRLYLFLRSRLQAEGYQNRNAAQNYLRSLLRLYPNDEEASVYAVRLLLDSSRREEQAEGQDILRRLLLGRDPSEEVWSLAVYDAIRREAWWEAREYLSPLLKGRRSSQDLLYAFRVERGLGNNAGAYQAARELYERDPANEEWIIVYASALIDTSRREEASRIIDGRLARLGGGVTKARYYYLRSRLRTSEEAVLNELKSSLFEDPRNLDAIIGTIEIYRNRRDDRRVLYYLRQALALAPNDSRIKAWKEEYASQL